MPNRVVREGLLSSDPMNRLKEDSQMLFVRLLLIVDDFGRYDGRDVAIKSAAYPVSDKRLTDVSRMLTDLVESRMVQRYVIEGKPYISVPKFEQRLRQKRERYPAPPEFLSSTDSISDSDSDSDSGNHACNCQTDDGQVSVGQKLPENFLFEAARKLYPGTKRGHATEWAGFAKHLDHAACLPLLVPAIEAERAAKDAARLAGGFCPEWPHFSTWINQRRWEQEIAGPQLPPTLEDRARAAGYIE